MNSRCLHPILDQTFSKLLGVTIFISEASDDHTDHFTITLKLKFWVVPKSVKFFLEFCQQVISYEFYFHVLR